MLADIIKEANWHLCPFPTKFLNALSLHGILRFHQVFCAEGTVGGLGTFMMEGLCWVAGTKN